MHPLKLSFIEEKSLWCTNETFDDHGINVFAQIQRAQVQWPPLLLLVYILRPLPAETYHQWSSKKNSCWPVYRVSLTRWLQPCSGPCRWQGPQHFKVAATDLSQEGMS